MKTTIYKLTIALLACLPLLSSCKKDEVKYSANGLSAVTLVFPRNATDITLYNVDGATSDFIWNNTGDAPSYLVFCNADKEEIYRIPIEGGDTIYHAQHRLLNDIAIRGDVAPKIAGVIYWGVAVTKGLAEALSELRSFNVIPYRAFNDLPVNLYITGPGSEGETDITKAHRFRETDEGQYQIYTYLKAGEGFYFTTKNTPGGGQTYTMKEGFLVTGNDEPITVDTDGHYRINLNFFTATMTRTAVSNVRYHVETSTATPWFTSYVMNYDGFGKWSYTTTLPTTITDGTNNRYKFLATVGTTTYSWGPSASQSAPPTSLEGGYFYVLQSSSAASTSSQTNQRLNTYRYMTELNRQEAVITLDMSADPPNYTHTVDIGDLAPVPVETLHAITPVALEKTAGAAVAFTWAASPSIKPLPKYDILFFKDAAGKEPIGSVYAASDSRFGTSGSVTHTDLELIANEAGIAREDIGDVWWGVRTTVLTKSVISATLSKLTITRIQGIPANCYITGGGTEGGSNIASAKKMKEISSGIFEIYTQLNRTNGTFAFTNGTTTAARIWEVTGLTTVTETATTYIYMRGTLGESTNYTTTPETGTNVYRVRANFNTGQVTFHRINNVFFYNSGGGVASSALTYQGNGAWSGTYTWPNTGDDRYYFRVDIGTATTVANYGERWASVNWNNDSAPTADTFISLAEWFSHIAITPRYAATAQNNIVYPASSSSGNSNSTYTTDQWAYSFKALNGSVRNQTKVLTINLYMSPDVEKYYHTIIYP